MYQPDPYVFGIIGRPFRWSLNYSSIICSDKVMVFQRFRNFAESWGVATSRDAAINQEITVLMYLN